MPQTFDTPLYTSDQSIDRVLNAGLPVALVFIDGAMPAALEQAMKDQAKQAAGRLLVVQLNIKDSPQTAGRYQVRATPALVTVVDGQERSRAESVSPGDLQDHIRYLLGEGPQPAQQPAPNASNASAGAAPASAGPAAGSAPSQPVTVTDASFEQEVMRSPIPVVVDFWAPWCGPCRMVAPTLDKLAREWSGQVKIAKINVDENPRVAGQFGVSGIPYMMVVKNGQILDQWAGAMPEPALRNRLGNSLR